MARKKAQEPTSSFRNRIVDTGEEDPRNLAENPENWREHPLHQFSAVERLLSRVGWVDRVLVNRQTGRMVDGHLRVKIALEAGEGRVPVDYVECSEEEERLLLAALDVTTGMAVPNTAKLAALARSVADELDRNPEVQEEVYAVTGLLGLGDIPDDLPVPDDLPDVGIEGSGSLNRRVIVVFEDEGEESEFWSRLGVTPNEGQVRYHYRDLGAAAS